jgi:hypothetical protein
VAAPTIPPPIIAISNFILKVLTKVHTIRELRHGNEKFCEKTLMIEKIFPEYKLIWIEQSKETKKKGRRILIEYI